MKKQISIYLLLIFAGVGIAKAQNNEYPDTVLIQAMSAGMEHVSINLPSIIHPSPVSRVFDRRTGFTPALATGAVHVPIPIYEIRVGNVSIPFSLDYHSNGITAFCSPFPAGYGWVLNPGLRITRTIRGRPDEQFRNTRPSTEELLRYDKSLLAIINPHTYTVPISREQMFDPQNDIYTIHLPTGSHTFLIDRTGGGPRIITGGNLLDINPVPNGFIVTDENGVRYYFGINEQRQSLGNAKEFNHHPWYGGAVTTWALTTIKLPGTNQRINFKWESFEYSRPGSRPNEFDRVFPISQIIIQHRGPNSNLPWSSSYHTGRYIGTVYNNTRVLRLRRVDFPLGEIVFNYANIWSADGRDNLLGSITIRNNELRVIRQVDFAYHRSGGRYEPLLASLSFSDRGVYRFRYNSARFRRGSLDRWGFNNGIQQGNLAPRMTLRIYDSHERPRNMEFGHANRDINREQMKAYILTRVDFPTGGFTEFEYEPHRFAPQTSSRPPGMLYARESAIIKETPLTEGGGLRVRRIRTRADANSPIIEKTYYYGVNRDGFAEVIAVPTLNTFIDEFVEHIMSDGTRWGTEFMVNQMRIHINSISNFNRYNLFLPALWYRQVVEYSSQGGRTVYNFKLNTDNISYFYGTYCNDTYMYLFQSDKCSLIPPHLFSFPRRRPVSYTSIFERVPKLVSKRMYESRGLSYFLVQQTIYRYRATRSSENPLSITNLWVAQVGLLPFQPLIGNEPNVFRLCDCPTGEFERFDLFLPITKINREYTIHLNWYELYEKTIINNVVHTERFTYERSTLLRTKTVNGEVITFKYPLDYAQVADSDQRSILQSMVRANNIASPISVTRTLNDAVQERIIHYRDWGNNLFLPEKMFSRIGNYPKEIRLVTHDVDAHGNILSITKDDAATITYLWAYGGHYPIAQIVGATYDEITAIPFINSLYKNIKGQTNPNMSDILNLGNLLRQNFRNAFVTVFTYKPLVGVTSITDPRGITTFYEYDCFGRLITIYRMNNGTREILQTFEYNLVNHTSECPPEPPVPPVCWVEPSFGQLMIEGLSHVPLIERSQQFSIYNCEASVVLEVVIWEQLIDMYTIFCSYVIRIRNIHTNQIVFDRTIQPLSSWSSGDWSISYFFSSGYLQSGSYQIEFIRKVSDSVSCDDMRGVRVEFSSGLNWFLRTRT